MYVQACQIQGLEGIREMLDWFRNEDLVILCVKGYREEATRLPLETIASHGAVWSQEDEVSINAQRQLWSEWKWRLQIPIEK